MRRVYPMAVAACVFAFAAACESSGAGGREVNITQGDDGCTPTRISATPGEKLKLVVKNESDKDYEIEGEEGAKLEELIIPKGKTRTPGYKVPNEAGTTKIKCYIPGGASTIIEVVAGDGGASSDQATPGGTPTAESDPTP